MTIPAIPTLPFDPYRDSLYDAEELYSGIADGDRATQLPIILVGVGHWSRDVPVWDVLRALSRDRHMAETVQLVDSIHDAANLITS